MESAQTTGRMTVKQYAKSRRISVQAVYKQINSGKLQTEKEQINGRYILYVLPEEAEKQVVNHLTGLNHEEVENVANAVNNLNPIKPEDDNHLNGEEGQINRQVNQLNGSDIENVEEVANQINPSLNSGLQPDQPPETAGDKDIIAFLQEQIRAKDELIAKKDQIITDQLAKMNELLRNSQLLQAQVNTLLLKGKTGEAEPEDGDQASPETTKDPEPEQTTEPQKKRRGFFYRLFFGED